MGSSSKRSGFLVGGVRNYKGKCGLFLFLLCWRSKKSCAWLGAITVTHRYPGARKHFLPFPGCFLTRWIWGFPLGCAPKHNPLTSWRIPGELQWQTWELRDSSKQPFLGHILALQIPVATGDGGGGGLLLFLTWGEHTGSQIRGQLRVTLTFSGRSAEPWTLNSLPTFPQLGKFQSPENILCVIFYFVWILKPQHGGCRDPCSVLFRIRFRFAGATWEYH